MALRRLRLVPRTALLMTPLGEQVTGQSGTAAAQLVGGAAYPNLPSGWSILSDRDFLTKTDGGWTDRGDAAFTIQTTATDAMCSQYNRLTDSTGRAEYRLNFPSGSGPISTAYPIAAANRNTGLYLRFNMAVSSNWYGESSGVNKVFFCCANGATGQPFYVSAQGATTSTLRLQVRLQGAPAGVFGNGTGGTRNLAHNIDSGAAVVTRGVRTTGAIIATMNTTQADGTPNGDGTVAVYVNNILTAYHTDVCFRGNGSTACPAGSLWTEVKWNPTWGGNHVGETVPALQHMYMYDAAVGTGT